MIHNRLLLAFVNDPTQPLYWGILYSFAFFLNSFVAASCLNLFFWVMVRIGVHVLHKNNVDLFLKFRSAIIMNIYSKILLLTSRDKQKTGVGKILNHMGSDVDKIIEFVRFGCGQIE